MSEGYSYRKRLISEESLDETMHLKIAFIITKLEGLLSDICFPIRIIGKQIVNVVQVNSWVSASSVASSVFDKDDDFKQWMDIGHDGDCLLECNNPCR